jgi:hypothetical protein
MVESDALELKYTRTALGRGRARVPRRVVPMAREISRACRLLGVLAAASCSTTNVYEIVGDGGASETAVDAASEAAADGTIETGSTSDAGGDHSLAGDSGPNGGDSAPEAAIDASGPWGCLQIAPGTSNPSVTIQVQIIAFDQFVPYTLGGAVDSGNDLQIVQATPAPGIAVQPCGNLDPACVNPVAPVVVTGDAGIATFAMNGAFDGFYSMKRSDSFPTLFYPGRLLASEPTIGYPVAVLPFSVAAELGAAIGITVNTDADAGLGHIFEAVFDCTDRHAAGVSFSLAVDAGTLFYTENGVPSTSATQTDPSGAGGFLNVPAGSVTVRATIAGQTLQLPVYVRPASETLVYLRTRSRPGP